MNTTQAYTPPGETGKTRPEARVCPDPSRQSDTKVLCGSANCWGLRSETDPMCPDCRAETEEAERQRQAAEQLRADQEAQKQADDSYYAAFARVVHPGPGGNLLRINAVTTLPLAGLAADCLDGRVYVYYAATLRMGEDRMDWRVQDRYAADVARVLGLSESEATP